MRIRSAGKSLIEWFSASTLKRDDLAVVREADAGIERVGHRKVRAIELQHEAGLDDGAIFARHHVGQREQIFLDGLVMLVRRDSERSDPATARS